MIKWFRNLEIQSKLFTIFGVIILIGAVVVGINLYNISRMASGNQALYNLSQKLEQDYKAEILLRRLELAEQGYWDYGDVRRLTEHTGYNTQISAFISKTLLEANTPEERGNLNAMKRTLQDNEQTFWQFVSAYDAVDAAYSDEENPPDEQAGQPLLDQMNALDSQALDQLSSMQGQIEDIIAQRGTFVQQVQDQQSTVEVVSLLISLAALVVFFILAIIAAVVIATQVNQPVILLTEAAEAVIARKPEPKELARLAERTDEMGQLARAFAGAAAAIRSREEALKQQADALRARVEQSKTTN
jgi:methyl-accepting chemotaxis protein